jgi:hypothetical protein
LLGVLLVISTRDIYAQRFKIFSAAKAPYSTLRYRKHKNLLKVLTGNGGLKFLVQILKEKGAISEYM